MAHGAGLAAIWGSWARYVCGERIERFVQFAEHVMGVEPQETEQKTAEAGIAAMEDYELHYTDGFQDEINVTDVES